MTVINPPLRHELPLSTTNIGHFGTLVGERLPQFASGPTRNHHNDEEIARAAGLPAPVGYSLQYYGPVSHLMTAHYGERWLKTGEMAVSFIKPIYAGDNLTIEIGGREVQRPLEVTQGRVVLQVDCFNQRGDLVAAGTASIGDLPGA